MASTRGGLCWRRAGYIWQAFGAPRLLALASLHAMHSESIVVSMLPFVVIPSGGNTRGHVL